MSRRAPAIRREQILEAAVETARRKGYAMMTRKDIAERAAVSPALVSAYFGTMVKLRRTVMRYAVRNEVVEVVAQGIVAQDKCALRAPSALKQRAMESAVR
jgi:AcrR family transcriptional regulator